MDSELPGNYKNYISERGNYGEDDIKELSHNMQQKEKKDGKQKSKDEKIRGVVEGVRIPPSQPSGVYPLCHQRMGAAAVLEQVN